MILPPQTKAPSREGTDVCTLMGPHLQPGSQTIGPSFLVHRPCGSSRPGSTPLRRLPGYLGSADRNLGEVGQARAYLARSLSIFEAIKSPHTETVRRLIDDLD
jgi:hypothetical protein